MLMKNAMEEQAAQVKFFEKEMKRLIGMHSSLAKHLEERCKYSAEQKGLNQKKIKQMISENKKLAVRLHLRILQ